MLEGEWYVDADENSRSTRRCSRPAETVAAVFVDRDRGRRPDVRSVPANEAVAVADTEAARHGRSTAAPDRDLEPRADEDEIGDELDGQRPGRRRGACGEPLGDQFSTGPLDPVVLEFDNGVHVALNTTDIVDGRCSSRRRARAVSRAVADDAWPTHRRSVRSSDSGVAAFDRVALETFLDDKDVAFQS